MCVCVCVCVCVCARARACMHEYVCSSLHSVKLFKQAYSRTDEMWAKKCPSLFSFSKGSSSSTARNIYNSRPFTVSLFLEELLSTQLLKNS